MKLRATTLGLAWAACCLAVVAAHGQPPAGPQRTPAQLFGDAQALIREGRYDVAAERLKEFLAANPPDQVYLDLAKNDPTAFVRLRNVAVWSDEPAAHREAVKTVEEIIKRAEEANKKFYADPERISKFVRNLGASLEERVYAEQQLKQAGTAVVPVMVEVLRTTSDREQRTGIYSAIGKLEANTVPGFIAALDGLSDDVKLGVLRALANRSDLLNLLAYAETDFTPNLWYYVSAPGDEAVSLRRYSAQLLSQLTGGRSDRVRSEVELTRRAEPFVRGTARYRTPTNPSLWVWEPDRQNVAPVNATQAEADDYYAVRYLKWALDQNPTYLPAQDLFLTHSVERAVEKARFGELAQADPTLYRILAAAPSDQLIGLLEQALADRKSALALGLTQVLAARADKTAATDKGQGKPSVFSRALDYPDPRVQLAAAIGILRAPVPADHGRAAQVVGVLRRALAADPGPGKDKETGRAVVVDPVDVRGEKVAGLLRRQGYAVERFPTGRDLLRRINRAADVDLIVIDRHVPDPTLLDTVAMLRPDAAAVRRPILVVASTDAPKPAPLEHLLLRLALLVAATETSSLEVPQPFTFDPRRTVKDEGAERAAIAAQRDRVLGELYRQRLDRLTRLVEAANLPASPELQARLDVRLPQVTYAALAAQYPITAASAPETYKRFDALNKSILNQPRLTETTISVPTGALGRIVEQLELVVNPQRLDPFDPEVRRDHPRLQQIYALTSAVDPDALGLPADTSRDAVLEDRLTRMMRPYLGVTVVPEPFTLPAFAAEVRQATGDPSQKPRDPAEKRQAARVALEWLRRMAVGEVEGYDIKPAADALRQALRDDEFAPLAIEAVGRIPTAEAQQDLLFVALGANRPAPIREKAAEQTVRHIQSFGKLIPPNQIDAVTKAAEAETDNELKAKLLVIRQLLAGKPGDIGNLITRYPVPIPQPPPPPKKEPAPGEEPVKKPDVQKK